MSFEKEAKRVGLDTPSLLSDSKQQSLHRKRGGQSGAGKGLYCIVIRFAQTNITDVNRLSRLTTLSIISKSH